MDDDSDEFEVEVIMNTNPIAPTNLKNFKNLNRQ